MPSPSIERTGPGKPSTAAHVERCRLTQTLGVKGMCIALRQLSLSDVHAILEQKDSLAWLGDIHSGALPPVFVLRRASAKVLAGEPERWWLPFLIVEQGERAVVGGCAFKGAPTHGRVEVLYGVSKTDRGRGIASAALGELAAVAFANGAAEVLAEVEPHNAGSIGVAKRCGFIRIGERKAEDGVVVEQWVLARSCTPHPSIERTLPGEPVSTSHVKR